MVQWQTCEHGDGTPGSVQSGEIRNSFLLQELSYIHTTLKLQLSLGYRINVVERHIANTAITKSPSSTSGKNTEGM